LQDSDQYILAEAARAINDDFSIPEALPDLARLLERTDLDSEPLLRRAINAALRTGDPADLDRLLGFARRSDAPAVLREEALAAMGSWGNPSVLDRVDGRFRGALQRDSTEVIKRVLPIIPELLEDSETDIIVGGAKVVGLLGITEYAASLKALYKQHSNPKVRQALLTALAALRDPEIYTYLQKGMEDASQSVRSTAIGLLPVLDLDASALPGIVDPIFRSASVEEQQSMLATLGAFPLEKSQPTLVKLIGQAKDGDLSPAVILDLIEAVEATESEELIADLSGLKLDGFSVDAYQETLYGGSWWPGMTVFTSHPAGQCVRCHAVGGAGGQVGPALDSIGAILSREELLESLVHPGARLAPGYGSVQLTLTDGQLVSGLLLEENAKRIILRTAEAEPLEIPLSRISKRVNQASAMPAMGQVLSRRELRDLIEYLASLKGKPDS
jgi:putative heme-binding domain-containing protein